MKTLRMMVIGLVALAIALHDVCVVRSDSIYWTDFSGGDIRRANLDGSGQQILITGLPTPTDLKLDLVGGQMYWSEYSGGDIRRANLDGSGQAKLVSGLSTPTGIALDLAGGKLYWADAAAGVIGQANLDGSGKMTLLRGLGYNGPHSMALDLASGKMYWANASTGEIQRANFDGSGLESILGNLGSPHGLAVDFGGGKVYWSDWTSNTISRANLDGSGREPLVGNLPTPAVMALDVTASKMYWANIDGGDIRRANLDGTGQETLIGGLPSPVGIALDIRAPVPQPVPVMGYSADVISDKDPTARFAQPFNGSTFAWFESGAVDDSGAQHNDGLPAGLIVSATGSGATYQLQPPNANNVLQLSAGQTGTLTLMTPAAYRTLYVLASSGDGTMASVGSGTINFADGSVQPFSYNCFDWCNGQAGLHPEAILPGPNGRADVGPNGTAFVYDQDCDFQIYETVITIDPSHAGVAIASIDFTGASDAFFSNIFGLSGL